MADRIEARRDRRYTLSRTVRIITREGQAIAGTVQNVGLGGMLVAVPVELELGRTYQIEISDSEGVFCLLGEALRLHLPPRTPESGQAAGFRIGFEFVGTDPATGERLSRLSQEAAT
jgi:hypothetical protein